MENIIVVGAGMAGIMAARTLRGAGYEVTILEARDRIGGRTHTNHALDSPVDLGAAWIHGADGNPLMLLARELNLSLGYTDFLNRSISAVQAYDEDGSPLDQAEYANGISMALGAFYNAAGSELYTRSEKARTLKDWLEYGLPKPDHFFSRTEMLGFRYYSLISSEYVNAADWDLIDWNLSNSHVELPGGDHLLYGSGFEAIIEYLFKGVSDLRLDTAVTRITVTDGGVALDTSDGQFTCDRLVLTVPLGVLKKQAITFDPPLPAAKTGAIERIGFGNYEKLALRFDKFYWPKSAQRFNYLSTGEPSLFHAWLNLGHYSGEPVIILYHAGRRARHINQLSDDELIDHTLEVMQRIFGDNGFGKIPAPKAYVRTNWQADPFAQGSYSFDQIGQRPGDRRLLAEPVGERLFFAGEASHPHYYATVHGAYETGIRAAREIIALSWPEQSQTSRT